MTSCVSNMGPEAAEILPGPNTSAWKTAAVDPRGIRMLSGVVRPGVVERVTVIVAFATTALPARSTR